MSSYLLEYLSLRQVNIANIICVPCETKYQKHYTFLNLEHSIFEDFENLLGHSRRRVLSIFRSVRDVILKAIRNLQISNFSFKTYDLANHHWNVLLIFSLGWTCTSFVSRLYHNMQILDNKIHLFWYHIILNFK